MGGLVGRAGRGRAGQGGAGWDRGASSRAPSDVWAGQGSAGSGGLPWAGCHQEVLVTKAPLRRAAEGKRTPEVG